MFPKGNGEAETPHTLGAIAAVPWPSLGHKVHEETGAEASNSHPASSGLANLPAGSQATGGSLRLNFPAWKMF